MNSTPSLPLVDFMSMLYVHGKFINVAAPDFDKPMPSTHAFNFIQNGSFVGGSAIGSKSDALEMLQLAADKGIKPWIEELPMKDVSKALAGVENNKVRYRFVLTQDLN